MESVVVVESQLEQLFVVEYQIAELVHDLFGQSWTRKLESALSLEGEVSAIGTIRLHSRKLGVVRLVVILLLH